MSITPYSIFAVALGGAFGASLRFYVGYIISKTFPTQIPLATLSVNIVGSFFAGVLIAIFIQYAPNENIKLFLITGFLGALTTYSTFAIETYIILNNSIILGVINIILNVIGTIIAAGIGYKLVLYFLR